MDNLYLCGILTDSTYLTKIMFLPASAELRYMKSKKSFMSGFIFGFTANTNKIVFGGQLL